MQGKWYICENEENWDPDGDNKLGDREDTGKKLKRQSLGTVQMERLGFWMTRIQVEVSKDDDDG